MKSGKDKQKENEEEGMNFNRMKGLEEKKIKKEDKGGCITVLDCREV